MDWDVIIWVALLCLCIIGLVISFVFYNKFSPRNAGHIEIFYDEEGQEHFNIKFTLELEEIEELNSIILDIIRTQKTQPLK